ncbi:MAG TPA: hypothetical protein VGH91_13540 [Gammaproteobacteria bacterium]
MTLQGQTRFNGSPARQQLPLAQVEVLLLFHPLMQSGCPRRVPAELCARAAQGWLTLDVYGRRGASEFTGHPIIEDMRLEVDGEDIESMLPDGIVNEVADYILKDA